MTDARITPPAWVRRGRVIAAVIVAVSIVALALMALAGGSDTFALASPAGTTAPRPATTASTPAPVQQRASTTPPHSVVPVANTSSSTPPTPPAPPTTDATPDSPPPVDPAPNAAPCPYPVPPAEHEGGIADLISLSPAFGPFSAEAFAMAPAYQPILRLFGPFLPVFVATLDKGDPATTQVINALNKLATASYGALGPLYGPHRTEFVAAEAQLATALAPYAQQLGNSALATCVIGVEGALAPSAK